MCLIIARTKMAAPIPQEYIDNATYYNRDGFGIVAKHNGKIMVERTLDMDKATTYIRLAEEMDAEFLAHFRLRTDGEVSLDNTHPFNIGGNNYLVHNGRLQVALPAHSTESDTSVFAKQLRNLKLNISEKQLRTTLKSRDYQIKTSRLALLGEDIPLMIHNESSGIWRHNVWYSNKWTTEVPFSYTTTERVIELADKCYLSPSDIENLTMEELTTLNTQNPKAMAICIEELMYEMQLLRK